MRRKIKNSEAFTLVELLVVVSIIALLLSILMPSLSKARECARSTVCRSNLKQIYMAYTLYRIDHARGPVGFTWGGNLRPNWSIPSPNPYPAWSGWFSRREYGLGYYLEVKKSKYKSDGSVDVGITARRKKNKSVEFCPSTSKKLFGNQTSYALNGWLGYDTYLGDHVKLPSQSPMILDGIAFDYERNIEVVAYSVYPDWRIGSFASWRRFPSVASRAHKGAANFLFFDGHNFSAKMNSKKDLSLLSVQLDICAEYKSKWAWNGN